MQNTGLDDSQAGTKIARRSINSLRRADDSTLTAGMEEKVKSLLVKVREESEKAGFDPTFKKLRPWPPVPLLHGK